MMHQTPSDIAYLFLHRSGWSIGDTAFDGPEGRQSWLTAILAFAR